MKLLLAILLTFSCLAQQITPIQKGDTSPFSGYVIDVEMERSMRSKLETEKHRNLLLSDLNVLKDKRIAFHRETSEEAYKELRTQRVKTTLYTIGGFTLGIGLSALAVYALKGAMR